jgi:translation initiation factor IF-2
MLTRIFRTKKSKENADKTKTAKDSKIIIDTHSLTVKILSEKIGITVPQIIKQLMVLGQMCAINSIIDFATAELVSAEFGIVIEQDAKKTYEEKMTDIHHIKKDDGNTQPRPPVVTIMGHVDHGKTTLLDKLRNSNIVKGEHGGITQHIGAYQVEVAKDKKITFLDTPGHAAFDKMRARGAKITDIAILIVAGDDGVMPQTLEAIKHIQGQGLPMIVAVNKCDKPNFDLESVRNQLSEHNVISEEWGGDTIIVPISAATGEGLPKLLEMILLVADIKNCRANYDKEATGAIIEAKLDSTKGPVVTILVQNGTLQMGDTLLAGTTYGKVRTMKDDMGRTVKTATPGMPVQITGFGEVPNAGDNIFVVDEKLTKQVVAERKNKEKVTRANKSHSLADFDPLAEMRKTDKKQLNIILKADVSGSLEAIAHSIANITCDEVNINIIGRGVGTVTDNDIDLASITDALVISFNSKNTGSVQKNAEKLKVKIHSFNIIYEIFDFVTEQMVRLFTPKFEQDYIGKAEVRKIFKTSTAGQIAGCMVIDGKIARGYSIIVKRGGKEIGKFGIDSLKIKTEDVKEVLKGGECGIKLKDMPELAEGDTLECVGEHQEPIIFNGKEYKF